MQYTNPSPKAQFQRTRTSGKLFTLPPQLSPIQHEISPSTEAQNTQRNHRTSTSSEEAEVDIQASTNNDWQTMKRTKRNKISSPRPADLAPPTKTLNRYDILGQEVTQTDSEGKPPPPLLPQNHKPPPIFIHGVINYSQMIQSIREVAEAEQYFTKRMPNNVIKLSCSTPDTYRNIIKHFKEHGIVYHTYQLKEERA